VCTAALDIRVQTQPTLPRKAGIDRDGLGVRMRNYRFPLATPTIYGGDKSHPVKQPVLPDPGYVDPAQLIVP